MNRENRWIALLLSMILMVSLIACGQSAGSGSEESSSDTEVIPDLTASEPESESNEPENIESKPEEPEDIGPHVLKIYPDSRKIICGREEVNLTTKEYKLLCLLAANKGIVLTYGQIYQKVWGEEGLGNESSIVNCHIHNLREKLYKASPVPSFVIRCVQKVGYCLEADEAKHKIKC